MMKVLLFVIFSLFLFKGICQESGEENDSTSEMEQKSVFGVSAYIDYGKLALSFSDFETKYAGGIELYFFENFLVSGEYGQVRVSPSNLLQNIDYTADGYYLKGGLGYVFAFKQVNRLGFAAKYGISNFDDRAFYRIEDQTGLVEDYNGSIRRSGLSASWWELALISEKYLSLKKSDPESYLNKLVSFGFLFQVRFLLDYNTFDTIDVQNIPGYGRTFDKSIPAINLFVKFNFSR